MLYNLILSLIPITISGMELELYKRLLIKLLVCKIHKLDPIPSKIYYGKELEESEMKFAKGIAQGLPQSYFFGNICMIEISKIFQKYFDGESLFYVDDSVFFTNNIESVEDFESKLALINKEIKEEFVDKYIEFDKNKF